MQDTFRSSLVTSIRLLRDWERANIPMYGSLAGYQLFLELASMPHDGMRSLKEIYLSMKCAESTTRLLFRNLEADGWLLLPRNSSDQRFREFQLTDKFHRCVDEWLTVASTLTSSTNDDYYPSSHHI